MVRDSHVDNSTEKENDSSTTATTSQFNFCLSKPLKTNFVLTNLNKINLNMSTTNITANASSIIADHDFTFLQPNESNRFNNEFRIQKQKLNTNRAQPYTLTRPTNPPNADSTVDIVAAHAATNNINTSGSSSSTNNAVMARLSSMSSTFKSMFVKPKNSKHVDISAFQNKKAKVKQENEFKFRNESVNDYLLKLSSSQTTTMTTMTDSERQANSTTNSSICINAAQIPIKSATAKYIQANDDFLSERIKKLSKDLDDGTRYTIAYPMMTDTMHHHQQQQAQKADKQQTDTINTPSKSNKWTCMVCLRKHTTDMKICTICGTSRPSVAISGTSSYASSTLSGGDTSTSQPHIFQLSLNTSTVQSKLYSALTATSSAKKPEQLSPNSCASQTSSTTRNTNKYLKTWTCAFCNFANDNLKVVCMNCRSSKSDVKLDLKDNQQQQQQQQLPLISTHTIQTKRKLNMVQQGLDAMSSTTTSSSDSCNGRADDTDSQQSKKYKNQGVQQSTSLCTKCNTLSIDRTVETAVFLDSVTPTKPASFVSSVHSAKTIEQQTTASILIETKQQQASKAVDQQPQQPSLSTLFATASKKWTCKTCLVNNDDDKTICVCCMTPSETKSAKPVVVETKVAPPPSSSSSSVSITTTSGSQPSLGSLFASTGKKWTCKTCLVSNDDSKTSCVCCTSPREPADGTTVNGGTSSSSFPSATGGFGLGLKPTTSDTSSALFQFGVKPNESKANEPIKFGSTGFSLPTFDQKTSSQPVATATPSFSFGSGPQTTMTTTTAETKPLFPKIGDALTQDTTSAQPSLFGNQNRMKIGGDSTSTSESKLTFGSTSGLTFGAATTNTTASPQAPAIGTGSLFTFGSKKDEVKKPDDQAKSGFFGFNNPATTTSASTTTAAPVPPAVFTFGSSGLASSSINYTDNTATKLPSITNSQSGLSLFGSKSITETTTSGNMMQQTGSLFNATAPTATTTPSGGLFQFGATTSTSTLTAPSPGVFGSSTILPSSATPNPSTISSSLSKPFVFSGTEAPTTGFAAFNPSPPKPSDPFKSNLFPAATTNAFSFLPNAAAAATTTITTAASTSVFGTATPLVQTGFSGGFFGNTQAVDTPKPFVFGSTPAATPVATGPTNPITPFAFNNTNTGNNTEQMFGAKRPMATEAPAKDTAFKFNETPNFNFANPIGTPPATNALGTPAVGGSPAFVFGSTPSDQQIVTSQGTTRWIKKPTRKLRK